MSRDSDVQLSLYIRIPNPKAVASLDNGNMKESETSSEDVFLGNVKLEPRWDEQMQDEWFTLQGGTGKVRVQLAYKRDSVSWLFPVIGSRFDRWIDTKHTNLLSSFTFNCLISGQYTSDNRCV